MPSSCDIARSQGGSCPSSLWLEGRLALHGGSCKHKGSERMYVSTGGKERAQNVGRPPKENLIINIIYVSTSVLFVGLW